jgi:hypothetical protein
MAEGTFINFKINNLDVLKRADRLIPVATFYGLEQLLRILKGRVQKGTPVGIKYQKIKRKKDGTPTKGSKGKGRWVKSGALKKSWKFEHTTANTIRAHTDEKYSPIVERGLYPGIGKPRKGILVGGGGPSGEGQVSPRTVAAEGGIFSSRAVGGILRPIERDQAFLDNAVAIIRREIMKTLSRAGGK